jgi:diguanylate cyclase (GGDEF)-like protein
VIRPVGSSVEKLVKILFFIFSYLWTGSFIFMISQRLASQLHEMAMNDALTRVRNRRAMDKLLEFEMERVSNEVKDFSIILIDIDHFKKVNDTYGHQVGDEILQWFAATLQNNIRIQDFVARWGGEEFLILLPDTSLDESAQLAERLRSIVASSVTGVEDEEIMLTFSAGVSSSSTNRDVKELCKVADQALYLAKQTRNRITTQNEL